MFCLHYHPVELSYDSFGQLLLSHPICSSPHTQLISLPADTHRRGVACEEERHSGLGQSRRLAEQAAADIAATGHIDPVTNAVKTASLKKLSCIAAIGCAKSCFPTFNRHMYKDEISGLG